MCYDAQRMRLEPLRFVRSVRLQATAHGPGSKTGHYVQMKSALDASSDGSDLEAGVSDHDECVDEIS
jgi:hypothetical protein